MTDPSTERHLTPQDVAAQFVRLRPWPYRRWLESTNVPVHRGFFVDDLRTIELGWWEERACNAAFLELAGSEGVTEVRVTEVAPGQTLPPATFALDEVVYVVQGRGLTSVWQEEAGPHKTFEWQQYSLFLLPGGYIHQFTNAQGDKPARLLHTNYRPLAMAAGVGADLLSSPSSSPGTIDGGRPDELYSSAISAENPDPSMAWGIRDVWLGRFFPDMRAWDRLPPLEGRGGGGRAVSIQFTGSEMSAHLSLFPARTYKKAHRHGPGFVIVIPAGEGYSVMWQEGEEKVVFPWHEASLFVPPSRWFHQHFNVGHSPARYLALHPPPQFEGHAEQIEDLARDQIEYLDEDPFVRQKFEEELGKRGLTSLMPEGAYQDKAYEWTYEASA